MLPAVRTANQPSAGIVDGVGPGQPVGEKRSIMTSGGSHPQAKPPEDFIVSLSLVAVRPHEPDVSRPLIAIQLVERLHKLRIHRIQMNVAD